MAEGVNKDFKNVIAKNRRALFEYSIETRYEAGIVLLGSEVKSARGGKVNLQDSHAAESEGGIVLFNAHIAEYPGANQFNHTPTRPRKLLLNKKEIKNIIGKIKIKGYTLVALSAYFNYKNILKLELGLAKGKKLHDKREAIKERDWQRNRERIVKNS